MRRRTWVAGIAVLALSVAGCGSGGDEDSAETDAENNGTAAGGLSTGTVATAEAVLPDIVELGEDYAFVMPEGEFSAQFSFEVAPGAVVTIAASAPAGNRGESGLAVGPAGQTIRQLRMPPGGAESITYITSGDGGGRWNVELSAAPGDTIGFRIEAPVQADGGVVGDAGSHAGEATAVELGAALAGLLGDEDGEDWYAIPLTGGDVVTVTLDMAADTGTGGVSAEIMYNGSGFGFMQINPGGETSATQIFAEDQTGEAQLRVSGNGTYGFTIEAGPQMDGGTEGDAGGNPSAAKPATFGTIDGVVGGADTDDYYVFELPVDAVLSLQATGAPDQLGPARFALIHNGVTVENMSVAPGQTDSFRYAIVNNAGDSLHLHVSGGGGAYSVVLGAATQPDGGDGTGDAPDEEALAKTITAEGSFEGILNANRGYDGRDWYRFTASATAPLDITLSVDADLGANTTILVYDGEGLRLSGATASTGAGGTTTLTVDVETGLDYLIQVNTGHQSAYTLTFG